MLHVLNSNERNQAFIKFMAFFLITVTLIVCVVYVDFKGFPEARRKLLEERLAVQRVESQAQEQFVLQMESARQLLDSLDKSGKNQVQVDLALGGKLTNMENLRQRDSSMNGKFNAEILDSFLELQRLKKEMEKLRGLDLKVQELEAKNTECEASLDTYRSRVQAAPQQ